AHAAFFGVYGMLGLSLTLMCLRALQADREWKEGLLACSFWAMNVGLMAMIVLSLLPIGLLQTVASVQHGYWYSRSSGFLSQGVMQTLRWLRVPGDTLFALGAIGYVGSSSAWAGDTLSRRNDGRWPGQADRSESARRRTTDEVSDHERFTQDSGRD